MTITHRSSWWSRLVMGALRAAQRLPACPRSSLLWVQLLAWLAIVGPSPVSGHRPSEVEATEAWPQIPLHKTPLLSYLGAAHPSFLDFPTALTFLLEPQVA